MKVGKGLKKVLRRFRRDCWGPTATEYAVLLVLIIFGALSAISLMGSFLDSSIRSTTQAMPDGAGESESGDSGSGKSKKPKKPKKPKKHERGGGKKASAQGHSQNIAGIQAQQWMAIASQTRARQS